MLLMKKRVKPVKRMKKMAAKPATARRKLMTKSRLMSPPPRS